jgi:hypothetical protein
MTYKTYHVFTNENDEWYDSISEAWRTFRIWAKEFGTARLYEETRSADGTEEERGEVLEENCLASHGQYPN